MLRCTDFDESDSQSWPQPYSLYNHDNDLSHSKLRTTYAEGSWPALFRANHTLYEEARISCTNDLSSRLTYGGMYDNKEWTYEGLGTVQICCKEISHPCCFELQLKNLCLVRKNGQPIAKDPDKPSIDGSAKAVKAHINNFVMALQEAPFMKSLDVELEITRREDFHDPLDPPILEEKEVEDTVSWYLQPFRHLRSIDITFRYLGAPYSAIQGHLASIKNEVLSNLPVSLPRPLCVLYARFCSERAFTYLRLHDHPRARRDDVNLPLLVERLWVAQDTGHLKTFRQMQKEIFKIWKETREKFEES